MSTDVIMPQMGESIFEGTITRWLKKPGDTVAKDEPLFEISTDKVDAEIPSPVAGTLTEIKVAQGTTVQVNTVVAVVSQSEETILPSARASISAPATIAPQVQLAPPQVVGGIDVVMPQMGESIFEGTITRWLKKPGDAVEKDEPLFEISTDKVDAEIPAPVAGILTAIKTPAGATVQINTVVAVIGGSDVPVAVESAPVTSTRTSTVQTAAAGQSAQSVAVQEPGQPLRSSPLVRRIAKENNLDLARISGTGSNRRITKEDILLHLSQQGPGSVSPAPSEKSPAPHVSQKAELAAPQVLGQVVQMSKMRSIIAQRMSESVQISPHAHVVYKIDMTRIVRLREREKLNFYKHNAVKLTYMPFIAAAVAEALRKFPIVNSSLEGGAIRYHQNVHLGIAVALEWGLIVPVVREAENLNFVALARSIADLAERARIKKLKPNEASGSTFTLTNSGVFGGEFGTPIINQPESAILAIGGLKKEAVVLTDHEGNDTIAIRSMQHFCLGFDHRTIDGADASKFMLELQKSLENWDKPIG